MMIRFLKSLIPGNLFVPLKYFYNLLLGRHESELISLEKIVGFANSGDVAVDIGANLGSYSYKLNRMGYTVHAFEPNPYCVNKLVGWTNKQEKVILHNQALSNFTGSDEFFVPLMHNGFSEHALGSLKADPSAVQKLQVDVRKLDDFDIEKIKLIKIDVEGAELDVLEGAIKTIKKNMPIIICEIEQRHHENSINAVFEYLFELGYEGYFIRKGNFVNIDEFDVKSDQSGTNYADFNGSNYINNFIFKPKV